MRREGRTGREGRLPPRTNTTNPGPLKGRIQTRWGLNNQP